MKKLLLIMVSALLIFGGAFAKRKWYAPQQKTDAIAREVATLDEKGQIKEGDIIFQTSRSRQSQAIQLATHSKYSHCGLICKVDGHYFVYEAVQPVKATPVCNWIAKGFGGHFVIKRLKNAAQILTPQTLQKMKRAGAAFKGKSYDIYFDWSDNKIYCSELIWKIYQRATGLEVGKLEKLRNFDLSNPIVKQTMYKRYGNKIPLNETVISPVSIFNSPLLTTVASN